MASLYPEKNHITKNPVGGRSFYSYHLCTFKKFGLLISGYDEATSRCEEEDYSLLDHLTPGSTKFVTSKVDQDRTGSKSLMIWLGTQRQRTSNFRGEEWRWQSSKQKVASLDWAKGQPNNYNQARCSNFKKYSHQISVPL